MPNLIDFFKRIFLHVIPVCIILSQLSRKNSSFETVLSVNMLWHTLPEATGGINEKVTEDTAYQNFLNAKSFTTNAAHISMTPPFYYYCLAFWGIFDAFHDAIRRY